MGPQYSFYAYVMSSLDWTSELFVSSHRASRRILVLVSIFYIFFHESKFPVEAELKWSGFDCFMEPGKC